MFSSSHDGEVANAARMAEKLVKARGETWDNVIKHNGNHQQPSPPKPRTPYPWKAAVDECMEWEDHLTAWENEFLESLAERSVHKPLTVKQEVALNKIIAKIDTLKGMNW